MPDLGSKIQVEDDRNSDAETLVNSVGTLAKEWHTSNCGLAVRVGYRLNAIVFGKYNFDPVSPTSVSVPSFWAIRDGEGPPNLPIVLLWQTFCACLFGGIHCCAWNAMFPSIVDMWMWRAGAVLITGFPPLLCVLLSVINRFQSGSVPRRVFCYLNYGLIALYIIARVALLILAFTTLRDPAHRAFVDADWNNIF